MDSTPPPFRPNASRARTSRERYLGFVEDYKQRRLDDQIEAADGKKPEAPAADATARKGRFLPQGHRREYLREYLRWLRPHRYAVAFVFFLALMRAGLEMIEPLFMRYIIDRVLLNQALDAAARLPRLHLAGAVFLDVIVVSKPDPGPQGLPTEAAEHPRDALAPAGAVRPAAPPAAARSSGR